MIFWTVVMFIVNGNEFIDFTISLIPTEWINVQLPKLFLCEVISTVPYTNKI